MAKWTLRNYIDALREKIDEVGSTDYFKDNELTRYINAGINDMANELQIEDMKILALDNIISLDFKEVFVSDTEKTKQIQDRNTDILRIKTIFVDGKSVPVGTLDDKSKGTDCAYLWSKKLNFVLPKSGTAEIFYYRIPRELINDTDTTDVPEIYQQVPLIYALAQCRRKDENENDYRSALNDYQNTKQEMAYEIANRDNDGYSYIQINEYGGDM